MLSPSHSRLLTWRQMKKEDFESWQLFRVKELNVLQDTDFAVPFRDSARTITVQVPFKFLCAVQGSSGKNLILFAPVFGL